MLVLVLDVRGTNSIGIGIASNSGTNSIGIASNSRGTTVIIVGIGIGRKL